MAKSSDISGFYKLSAKERIDVIKEFADLTDEDVNILYSDFSSIDELERYASKYGENTIGKFGDLPIKIAPNFKINNKDYFIPMVLEEPSVVAAASNAARLARKAGGFKTSYTGSYMIGQIQLTKLKDIEKAKENILGKKEEILEIANEKDPMLLKFGGGAKDLEVRYLDTERGPMLINHLIVDVKDAMGANAVNTMTEAVAPYIEELTGGKVCLRIVSNLADKRLVRAEMKVHKKNLEKDDFSGDVVIESILDAYAFASADPYRATTHNKGIMNGMDGVAVASGQDWRAIEAGAHTYACKDGRYRSLSVWYREDDHLIGKLELPMAVGIVGGVRGPRAKLNLKILGVKSAGELAEVMGAVGLGQNFAGLYALATEGIQKGHMELHARIKN